LRTGFEIFAFYCFQEWDEEEEMVEAHGGLMVIWRRASVGREVVKGGRGGGWTKRSG